MKRYSVKVGRPREHDEQTRAALLTAAERLIEEHGVDGLSLRTLADEADTTTRAIYSLFGSKDGLLVALAAQAISYLDDGLHRYEPTSDPVADLVELGAVMYRTFVRERPSLFRLAFQRIAPGVPLGPEFFEERAKTWATLEGRLRRIEEAGLLGARTVTEATVAFNALCEGLANAELRGGTMAPGDQEQVWRSAFDTLIRGFAMPRAARRPTPRRSPSRGRAR
jgi:AcrR family transcriptional regulator